MKPMPSWHVRRLVYARRLIDTLLGVDPVDPTEPVRPAGALTDVSGVVTGVMIGCGRCGRTAAAATVTARGCPVCFKRKLGWHGLTRLGEFRGPVVGQIHRMKYMGRWPLADRFGRRLAARIEHRGIITEPGETPVVVTAVPMHWRRSIFRGTNHAEVLGWRVATELGLPYMPLLKRIRDTPTQVGLSLVQRRKNLRGAFEAVEVDLTGWTVLLIDDVMTTGATLAACCAALKKCGARRVHVGVIAVAGAVG